MMCAYCCSANRNVTQWSNLVGLTEIQLVDPLQLLFREGWTPVPYELFNGYIEVSRHAYVWRLSFDVLYFKRHIVPSVFGRLQNGR